ncbi:MAG: FCD domain-containing protein, partial [Lachnospiraceae bacterium]|nr:FCD domain-containing protein [Lachnospiraceae bacterium]
SEKDLIDVLEVRTALEELAVRLACSRIEYKELEKLEEINQRFIEACRSSRNDIMQIAQLDEEFHQLIYEVANNEKLLQLLNQMMSQMYRFRVEHIKLKERRQVLIGEHKMLIMALANRNEEAAIDAIRKHISNQEQYIMNEIQAHS